MNDMVRKSWLRECDRSPSRSPIKMNSGSPEHSHSPLKKKKNGQIISTERNPFNRLKKRQESPQKGGMLEIKLVNIGQSDNNYSSPAKNIR